MNIEQTINFHVNAARVSATIHSIVSQHVQTEREIEAL